jgi:GTP:adenosylcobinamide-phosphate guanylyltransferase
MTDTLSPGSVPAVVLAGGSAKPDFIAKTGLSNRALVEIDGRTMLDRVVGALREAPSVGEVLVVGNIPASSSYRLVTDHGGFVENIFACVEAAPISDYVLISTADVPFLSSEAVEDMIQRGAVLEADIVYPVVAVSECYKRFPGIKRTAVKLREGEFTGGNLVMARPEFLTRQRDHIAQVYAARKSPLKIAGMLGVGTTLRFAVSLAVWPGIMNIPLLERRVSIMLGGTARALISTYPELATDIDKVEDLEAIGAFKKHT